jgi:hypothetical protein
MREILLTQGRVALVDDADYEWLSQWKWMASRNKKTFYAVRKHHHSDGRIDTVLMHRALLSAPAGSQVDHKDGDGLNNCRDNIRTCTLMQNSQNRQIQKNNRSGYKGIYMHKRTGRWYAKIVANRKIEYLGSFLTPEDAARAYDRAALAHFGEFARLNFPQESTP